MIRQSQFLLLLAGALLFSCRVGPDYERPGVPTPDDYRSVGELTSTGAEGSDEVTYGNLEWFKVFDDPVLQELIRQALQDNYDLRLAAERVVEAREFITISEADLYPQINVGASFKRQGTSGNSAISPQGSDGTTFSTTSLFGDLSWELDFWGRYASASDAARADLMATELARQTVIQTLVCDLALAYFTLLELDAELEITRRTLESRQESLELVTLRLEQGVANKVEFRQSEGLVLQTASLLPAFEQFVELQENLIQHLVGGNPGAILRGRPLLEQPRTVGVPVGLPSELLARRPDVMAAEQELIAANARIGEAKALLYPSVRLTALGGVASDDLSDLLDTSSGIWSIAPSITLPIFNAGALNSNVEITEARQRQATLRYMQALQTAFREVADSLITHEKTEEIRGWRELHELTLRDQLSLSNDRYRGGVTSYLEVLDSERDHFDSEITLVQAIRDELFSTVFLYRALGGGWKGTAELAARGPQFGEQDESEQETSGQ